MESSGDEDNPLMMSSSKDPEPVPRSGRQNRGKRPRYADGHAEGRNKNLVRLASETDLMAKRMKGLAGGLIAGSEDGTATP